MLMTTRLLPWMPLRGPPMPLPALSMSRGYPTPTQRSRRLTDPLEALIGLCLILLVLLLTACSPSPDAERWGTVPLQQPHPTLRVLNNTGSHITVALDGRTVGRVVGRDGCLLLRGSLSGSSRLTFRALPYSPEPAPPTDLSSAPGWVVRLNYDDRLERDALSLQPAQPCNPRRS